MNKSLNILLALSCFYSGYSQLSFNLDVLEVTTGISETGPFPENSTYNHLIGSGSTSNVDLNNANINCEPPENVSISDPTTTSVVLNWDISPFETDGYLWAVYNEGAEDGIDTPLDFNTTFIGQNSITVTGLSPNTTYDAYLRTNCGSQNGGFSDPSEMFRFRTSCAPFNISFTEDFETSTSGSLTNTNAPECWRSIASGSGSAYVYNGSTNAQSGDQAYRLFNETDTTGDYMLVSPNISELITDGVQVGFSVKGTSGQELELGTMTDPTDASTFTLLQTSTLSSTGYEDKIFYVPAVTDQHVVFRHGQISANESLYIDDVNFGVLPSCIPPQNVQAGNITFSSADLSWDVSITEDGGYEYVVVPGGNAVGTGTIVSETTNSTTVSGLNGDTDHDVYVRVVCDNETSDWTGPFTFTTLLDNDNVCNAKSLNIDELSSGDAYSTVGATVQPNEPDTNFDNGVERSVWFTFVAPEYGNVQITTDIPGGTLTDTEVAVYSVDDCSDFNSFVQLGFDQDGGVIVDANSKLNLNDLNTGETYYIQVDRAGTTATGTFGIEVRDLSFTYNGTTWLPQIPYGITTQINTLIVESGTAPISLATTANEVLVKPGAILDLNADLTADVTFESDALGTAQLADATGNTITGDVTVERFIPVATEDTRAYRFLTSAVDSNGSIFENWQEGGNSPVGYGTHITGNNNGSNGVDQTISGNPSMYTFDNQNTNGGGQNDDWEAITDTKVDNLIAGEAYRMFIRGDRNYNLNALPEDPDFGPNTDVTLRATGSLTIGSYTHNLSDVAGYYSLVGNPYQAVVNFNDLISTNVDTNNYYVWDPNMSTRGAYVSHNLSTGINDLVSSATNEYIMPGQSFFVQTLNNGASSLEFTETAKDVDRSQTTVFSDEEPSYMNLLLYKDQDLNNAGTESDGIAMIFDANGNNDVDQMDANKLGNPDENLARFNNGQYLSIEERANPMNGEALQLYTEGYSVTDYTFRLDLNNINDEVSVYLIDHHNGEQTLMSGNNNAYSFTVDPNLPGSIATDRFSIEFEIETFGVDDNEIANNFEVYPNPVSDGVVNVRSSKMAGDDVRVRLYNMIGQRVLEREQAFEANGEMKLDIESPQAGVYFLEIDHQGDTAKERLIIK